MLLLLVGLGVGYALFQDSINPLIKNYCTLELKDWIGPDKSKHYYFILTTYGILFGSLFFVALVISFLIRFILHPIGCKAKKHRHCCYKCEWHKYVWTVVFVLAGLVALLGFVKMPNMPGEDYTLNFGVNKIINKIASLYPFTKLNFANPEIIVFVVGSVLIVLGLLGLIIATFKHKARCRRNRKLANETNEQGTTNPTNTFQEGVAYIPYMINGTVQLVPVAVPGVVAQPQQQVVQVNQPVAGGVQPVYIYSQMANQGTTGSHVSTYANPYNPGIYEDIESPYNMYRTGRDTNTYRSRGGRWFLKLLGVLVVLAAAYLFLAYKIQNLDFLNLFNH